MWNSGKALFNKHKGAIMKGVNAVKNRFSPKSKPKAKAAAKSQAAK